MAEIGVHAARGHYREARDLGFTFTFEILEEIHANQGFLDSGLKFVAVFLLTEARFFNHAGGWIRYCEIMAERLTMFGLWDRCLAIQFHDEVYEMFHGLRPEHFQPDNWPTLSHLPQAAGATLLPMVATELGARTAECQAVMGTRGAHFTYGSSATGAMALPPFDFQSWWGCDFYCNLGYGTVASVQRLYAEAHATGMPLMPVLGVFSDYGRPVTPFSTLEACYRPVVEQYITSGLCGVFCLSHPWHGGQGPNGADGRGILQLPAEYQDGVRWLTDYVRRQPSP